MTMLLDGKKIAAGIRAEVSTAASALRNSGIDPTLATVIATDDESAVWYARSLSRTAEKVGIAARLIEFKPSAAETSISEQLAHLGADPTVHGVILQTPLPAGVQAEALTSVIPVEKDVDGANPLSAGRVLASLPAFAPATASAVMEILDIYDVALAGIHAVVVGRSMVVGKPVAYLLLAKNATVTICHSRTRNLPAVARRADVLIAAIGRPRFIDRAYVKPGATIIDVGTTPDVAGNLVGDVDAAAVEGMAGGLTPVPGGVGPVTTAVLLRNTIMAASAALSL